MNSPASASPDPGRRPRKLAYHTANVFLCNYLVPLIDAGLQCYERAGVPREVAVQVAEPLLRATVDNALKNGAVGALTGPIARGDDQVVAAQMRALEETDLRLAELYRILGLRAADLAEQKRAAPVERLAAIKRLLEN